MEAAHALVIGVSRYDRVPPLPTTSDAEDVAALLADPARGGYPPAQVELVTEADATRDRLLDALDRLAARAAGAARVVVYFSGHGGSTARECYLMPVDGAWESEEALAATAIAGADLDARLRRLDAAQVTIVLDCCRAAGLARDVDAGDVALAGRFLDRRLAALAPAKGRSVLAAARADDSAYVMAGQRNGVFTHHLLAGLRGAAHRAGGVVRVTDLYHHVREQVIAEVPAQRPVFKAELEENYPLVRCPDPPAPRPTADDGFAHDAFVSYEPSQRAWIDAVLVPRLEDLGVSLAIDHRTFRPGHAWVDEAARAAERSRYTVAVVTPAYLTSGFQRYEAVLGRHLATDGAGAPRFVPLLRGATALPLGLRVTAALDLTRDADVDAALARLAVALREPL